MWCTGGFFPNANIVTRCICKMVIKAFQTPQNYLFYSQNLANLVQYNLVSLEEPPDYILSPSMLYRYTRSLECTCPMAPQLVSHRHNLNFVGKPDVLIKILRPCTSVLLNMFVSSIFDKVMILGWCTTILSKDWKITSTPMDNHII